MESEVFLKLKSVFKFEKFKSTLQQNATIEITQRKNDVLVSMPTGSGKSLCYQLPAVLYPDKVTIVFSPLLALIKDQLDHLKVLRIRGASLNSKTPKNERECLIADLKSTKPLTRLLYITPEQAVTATFKSLYENLIKFDKVAFIVIDEAHCVSEWGHDFRPHYLRLGELRDGNTVPCIALTATANLDVTNDIITNLKLVRNLKRFKTTCFRQNLFYDVFFQNLLDDPFRHLTLFINDCLDNDRNNCGIIYCRTREQTELLSEKLNQLGVKSKAYHAGLKNSERLQWQDEWQKGDFPVICATVSFGMGVDKASVRFVVHWSVPKDPASFYQESGRAGRDGNQSKCRIYYNRSDARTIEFLLNREFSLSKTKRNRKEKAENAIKSFKKMVEFCENPSGCRHKLFSDFFGDPPPKCVNRCDFCMDKKAVIKTVEQFHISAIEYNTKKENFINAGDLEDLYGGGRLGQASENNDHQSSGSGEEGFDREKRAKKQSIDLIRKQFAVRRSAQEVSQKTIEQLFSDRSRVTAAASTSSKIKGLTLALREQYLSKLSQTLYENYEKNCSDPRFAREDVEDCAIDMEYNVFTVHTNMTMFRTAFAKLLSAIKKNTELGLLHPDLCNFSPKPLKNATLVDLFRSIERDQKSKVRIEQVKELSEKDTFQTALQVYDSKQTKIDKFFVRTSENMDEKNKNLKKLFGDESEEETDKDLSMTDNNHQERKRKHDERHKRQDKKQKIGESSIDKEYEKFVEAVENSTTVQKENGESSGKVRKTRLKKTEIGNLVVKLLTPAYVERRFESRETFKSTARNISHALIDKDENEIKEYVENFLKKNEEITSQTVL